MVDMKIVFAIHLDGHLTITKDAPDIPIATVAAIGESLGLTAILYEAEGFVHLAI